MQYMHSCTEHLQFYNMEYLIMKDLSGRQLSKKEYKEAKALCMQLKKEVQQEPLREPDAWSEGYSSDIRISSATAVHVYPRCDGWAADLVFECGKDYGIIQPPYFARTRDEVIQLAKDVLHRARTREHDDDTGQKREKLVHPFDLCGHYLNLWQRDDDCVIDVMVKYLISTAQDMFYDKYNGDIGRALKDPRMLSTIHSLSVMGYWYVPEREQEETTVD